MRDQEFMYIKSAHITNTRSIKPLTLTFDNPAGWHVLIGENGSGKTTVIQAIALDLIGRDIFWINHERKWDKTQLFRLFPIVEEIKRLINAPDFLPNNAKLQCINSEGVMFCDGNGYLVEFSQLSDGYRSILNVVFELVWRLIKYYGEERVFKNIRNDIMTIDLPGVVLIDEIDAHLHPTWQTRVGQWFTKHFPSFQFIVTTHSPLICRACENGTIWHLSAPGSSIASSEITGKDKNRLIYGNILDAYGTELFGQSTMRSQQSEEMLILLGRLNIKSALGKITDQEEIQRIELQQLLSTDDPTGF